MSSSRTNYPYSKISWSCPLQYKHKKSTVECHPGDSTSSAWGYATYVQRTYNSITLAHYIPGVNNWLQYHGLYVVLIYTDSFLDATSFGPGYAFQCPVHCWFRMRKKQGINKNNNWESSLLVDHGYKVGDEVLRIGKDIHRKLKCPTRGPCKCTQMVQYEYK